MYHISILASCGVFSMCGDAKRVKHEIKNLYPGWRITIWELDSTGTFIRKCKVEEFADA